MAKNQRKIQSELDKQFKLLDEVNQSHTNKMNANLPL